MMDHCHLEHQANYSFDQFNDFKYDSGNKIAQMHTESGYESLLATSANSTSFFQHSQNMDSNDSSVFSLPTTPAKYSAKSATKIIYNGSNCSTTPDFKQQYVADVNAYYFKSIRSSYDGSSSSDMYPSSQSQSPKQQMNYCPNADSYVTTRDNLTSKLLRSPAFKLDPGYSPSSQQKPIAYQPIERPTIKSFSSRFISEMPKFEQLPSPPKPTPTEAEFMQMLITNHHIPDNPEFLIGRNMGIEHLNILGELNKRSMKNVLDKIYSYLSIADVVRVGCVSQEWRTIIKHDTRINKERVRYIKAKRHVYETTKENHIQSQQDQVKRPLSNMMLNEKRAMFKSSKSCLNNESHLRNGVFSSLDVNRLNNCQEPVNQRKKLLERQFRDFSITEDSIFSMSPTKRSPVKRCSPLKRSPRKPYSPIKKSSASATPQICSKKSKKNLKRL